MAPETEIKEFPRVSEDYPAVNEGAGHHEFKPSEFAPMSGRCDICGGGPMAPLHLPPVELRIAAALERIADTLDAIFTLAQKDGTQ